MVENAVDLPLTRHLLTEKSTQQSQSSSSFVKPQSVNIFYVLKITTNKHAILSNCEIVSVLSAYLDDCNFGVFFDSN